MVGSVHAMSQSIEMMIEAGAQKRAFRRRLTQKIILSLLFACAAISVVTTVGIVLVLAFETAEFFKEVPFTEFFFTTEWAPLFSPQHFGVVELVAGTLMIAVGAILVAAPIGLAAAMFLSEYAKSRTRAILKPILEILAGVPTVVYGYFALTFVTPLLRYVFPEMSIFNALSAAIVVGIMIVPMIFSLSDDAMRAVPRALKEGAYGLGATKLSVSVRVVVPAALSGIVASFILGISRAVGETMIVTIAAGATPTLTWNPLDSIQTMTAYIVQVSMGDTPVGSLEYKTIFAVGALLFVMTLIMNLVSQRIVRRYRQEY